MSAANPRIGIIGTGAIGGFYGLMLARAGFDVHFLLRSEYDAVLARGLQVNSAVHGPLLLEQPQIYRDAARMPQCDWLLVGAKSTSNQELAPVIAQVAAPGCKVVVLQNGLGVEDVLRPFLPENVHLLGGLCAICAHRSAPGAGWGEHWLPFGACHPGSAGATGTIGRNGRDAAAGRSRFLADAQPGASALDEAGVERPVQRPLGSA